MDVITEMVRSCKKLTDKEIGQQINRIVKRIEQQVIKLVTQKQIYERGEGADGGRIRPLDRTYDVYSSMYEAYKSELGKYQGHVDLSLSGEFLRSWKIVYFDDGLIIQAGDVQRDGKNLTAELRFRYGEFEGLQEGNLDELISMVREELIGAIRAIILGQ
jgi:hypothetical protein